jgi:subtilisin family serine protease
MSASRRRSNRQKLASVRRQRQLNAPEQLESRQLLAVDFAPALAPAAVFDNAPAAAVLAPAAVSQPTQASAASPFLVNWQGRQLHAVPGEFVFQFKSTTTSPTHPADWSVRSLGTGTWLLTAPGASESQINAWTSSSGATHVEPNYILQPLGTPIDPEFPDQWHLPRINAPAAWDTTTGSASVIVAVLDSGIDYDHPDFSTAPDPGSSTPFTLNRRNIWQNPNELPNNGIDDDKNGYIDDYFGYDFGNRDSDPMDNDPSPLDREDADIAELGTNGSINKYTGHGTAVAGVMGAVAGTTAPQQMVAGVNWDLKMMALKITRPGFGYVLSAAVEAYKYIQTMREAKVNITVANCSWGTYDAGVDVRNLEKEIILAGGQNVLTVAAAGDKGLSNDRTPFFPASFGTEYVLSVAATNRNDSRWTGNPDYAWRDNVSNYGPTTVDVAAPGREILTTISRFAAGTGQGSTGIWEGSSMAAGIVSGVAALMKAASPTAPALALKNVIINTVDKVPGLRTEILSGGIVNASAAVAEILLPADPAIDILHLPGQEAGVTEGHKGFTSATWQIRVKGPLNDSRTLYVDYRTDDTGSATPDGRRDPRTTPAADRKSDYVPVIGTMAFTPGPRIVSRLTQVGRETVDVGRIRSVPVRIFGDRNVEGDETMTIRIDRAYYRNPNGTIELANRYILTRTNDFTIIDDDIAADDATDPGARTPTIVFAGNSTTGGSTVEVVEGDAGTKFARFPVKLSMPTTNTVTVRYRTRDVDARAGADYVAKTGMVTFKPNVLVQYIDIPVHGNRIGQGDRSFLVDLFDPTNGALPGTGGGANGAAGSTATCVILDDDAMVSVPGTAVLNGIASVSATKPTSGTGLMTVTLTLTQPVKKPVSVSYATRDFTARAGQDYVAKRGTAIIAAGTQSVTFTISLLSNNFTKADATFFVDLKSASNAALMTKSVRCSIL